MRSRFTHSLTFLAACLIAATSACAQSDSGSSLYQKRLEMIKGTAPGIVILKDPASEPAASTSSPSASSPSGSASGAQASRPTLIAPPTGRPVNSIKRLEGPDVGIVIPSGRAASQPAGNDPPK